MKSELKINGMTCEMCQRHITNALQSVPGVDKAVVDLHVGKAFVEHQDASLDAMLEAVQEEGYVAQLFNLEN